MIELIRKYLWKLLGIGKLHIQWVSDKHFLKEDRYTHIGYKSYDNNAIVYRWSDAPLFIGKYCSISYGVKFILDDGKHTYNRVSSYPFKSNTIADRKGITIENDVWIGMNVTILPGVTIGNGATIAAGAVVINDIPEYCVAAGVPAKVVKQKCSIIEAEKMRKIAWWDWEEDRIESAMVDFQLDIKDFVLKYEKN